MAQNKVNQPSEKISNTSEASPKMKPAIRAKQRLVPTKHATVPAKHRRVPARQTPVAKQRKKTARPHLILDKGMLHFVMIDEVQANDSPWVYAITYHGHKPPIEGMRHIYRLNSAINKDLLLLFNISPKFKLSGGSFEEYLKKHEASRQKGQGYDWNADPGQRVITDVKSIGIKEFVKQVKEMKKDPRYRNATPFENWCRRNIDVNAWDDLVDMAFDDAIQVQLPKGGKDPDGEAPKIIYDPNAVNHSKGAEDSYNNTHFGEEISKFDRTNGIIGSIFRRHPIYTALSKSYMRKYVLDEKNEGYYFDSEDLERKYCYYPVTIQKTNHHIEHYIYKLDISQIRKITGKQIIKSNKPLVRFIEK